MMAIVRASEQWRDTWPPNADVRIALVRQTPSIVATDVGQTDLFCVGEDAAFERFRERGWNVVTLRDGWYEDDDEGGVAIRVRAAPERGRATEEALRVLADALAIPRGAVRLRTGARSRRKLVELLLGVRGLGGHGRRTVAPPPDPDNHASPLRLNASRRAR